MALSRISVVASMVFLASVARMSTAAAEPNVVVTIKPLHSLVSAVMKGAGYPKLLLESNQSPHSFSLKPSQAGMLQNADAIVWVGPGLESFLEKSLTSIAPNAKSIEMMETPGLHHLEANEHEHNDHDEEKKEHADHDDHDDHKDEHVEHDDHDDHKDEHAEHDDHDDHKDEHAEHDDHDDHASDEAGRNVHIWLDPENARAMVKNVAEQLAALDPGNADLYRKNAASSQEQLSTLIKEVSGELSAVKGTKFMAFHDAYGHFEHRFGMESAGSLTINPEVSPGAKRLSELRTRVKSENIKCVFSEPQFDAGAWTAVIENSDLNLGVVDPLGVELTPGPDMYYQLIRGVAGSLKTCLSK